MPCRYDGPDESLADARKELDRLTKLLCMACRGLEIDIGLREWPVALRDWWQEHQKRDAERIKAEKVEEQRRELVKSALRKLTPDEILALGAKSADFR